MPFINSFGSASSRGYGFTRGGGGGDPVITAIRTAFGLAGSVNTYSQPQGWTYVDLRNVVGSPTLITVSCAGSRGGGGGSYAAGYGASVVATVPTSFLAGKIIGFVNAGSPPGDVAQGRSSSGGGGFSGIIQLSTSDYAKGNTLTHVITAGGGGGANGGGDNGRNIPGQSSNTIVYSGSPSGGISLAKNQGGSTGYYPSLSYAAKAGNSYGGGDGASDNQGRDLFVNGGGGGFGPRRGVQPNGNYDPSGRSTGMDLGYSAINPINDSEPHIGAFGGGGCGAEGASGGVPWRVISSGGGGGGFNGGNTGWDPNQGDTYALPAGGGTSFCWSSGNLISHSGGNSSTGYCNLSWTA